MLRSVAAFAAALIVVACGGGDGSKTTRPATVASVTLSQQSATIDVGTTLILTATAKDASGNVITGRTTTWTSSNSSVATVDNGIVTGISVGTATITATIDGKPATALITVQLPPVASITITPATKTLTVGASFQLVVTVKDANGNPLSGRTVTWTTSDATKVTVSSTGLVTGVALGTAIITATSEGKFATATITVSDGKPPVIGAIAPDTIAPGVTVTITGTGFEPNPPDNTVTIGGTPVFVTAASATQLSFVLPANFPCLATQRSTVVVTTSLGTTSAQKPLKVAITRSLAVGESLLLTDVASVACNELAPTGGRYLMSVYNTSTVPTSTASFELKGNMAPTPTPVIAPTARSVAPIRASITPLSAGAAAQIAQQRDRQATANRDHARLLENDRALVRSLGTTRRGMGTASRTSARPSLSVSSSVGGASSPSLAPVPLTVGAYTSLRIRSTLNTCQTFNTVRARVVFVGTKSVVLEDSLSPTRGTIDTVLTNIGQQFDNVMYPILTQNFGDPLAYDDSTDHNGRILMLFTPRIDSLGGSAGTLQGFVSACDLYPPTIDPSVAASNQAEIFYARVPASAAQVSSFRRSIYGTVIHESKHLAANAEKFARNADVLEESWLEEGTAQIALELYARTRPQYAGVTWKSDATYLQTVYCDVRPSFAGRCLGSLFLDADPLFELHDYERANETKSFLSRASDDITIYGSAWQFTRWATDQYATVEGDFLKSIVLETRRGFTGVANIVDKTRRPFTELDGWFTLALLADNFPGFTPPPDAKYIFPSFNTPDIFRGAATDFPNSFVASPLNTHVITFGDFTVPVPALAGGSGSLFNLSGTQTGPQAIGLQAPGGGAIGTGTTLRIVFLRVQ